MIFAKKEDFIEYTKRRYGVTSHINCSICSACGGKCCKVGGCGLLTCDIPELSINGIRKMLDSGKYSITFFYHEALDAVIPTMNAREINAGRINPSCIRKPCSLCGTDGCTLSKFEQPTLGLLYIPYPNNNCKLLVNSTDVFTDWLSIQPLMEQVVFEETGKTSTELFYNGCIAAAMEIRNKLYSGIDLTTGEIEGLKILDATGVITMLGY